MELIPVLQIDGLDFQFATRALFTGFSLRLGTGVTWLRGANGAGKTTLLKLAGGALNALAGSIRLDGVDSRGAPLAYRRLCFYCGGDTPQLPWLTVREFLDIHLALYPAFEHALLDAQLRAFELLPTLAQGVDTLSLGQHKKLQLSLALALPVRLLLIDEPFNGLDVAAVACLRRQLAEPERLARQCIVLTSHIDPEVALAATVVIA
ncbi:MAG TPA: ABC transporter ATP-binding protein [Janthinobacterium sp.]|nr:ABC transporter ATP-binding protein [Janthinobacterium sp.]